MKRYYLRLRALSPISITGHQNVAGQAGPTLTHIPGTTLRGALAWRVLAQRPEATRDTAFQALFAPDGLRPGPLYPLSHHPKPDADLALPLPLTARSCKRHAGFCTDPNQDRERDPHGALDTLVDALEEVAHERLMARGLASAWGADEKKGLRRHEKCGQPGCGAAMDRFAGYYQSGIADGARWFRTVRPSKLLLTRTAIMAELGSARQGALFSREALAAGQEFAGLVDVPAALVTEFEQLFKVGDELQIGAGRTAGLGRLAVADVRPDWGVLSGLTGTVAERQQAFVKHLPAPLTAHWALTPITLWSDAILLDPWLRYASAPEPDVLRYYAELAAQNGATPPEPPAGLELFLCVGRATRCAAWHAGSRTADGGTMQNRGGQPRTQDLGIAAGSTFVLAAPPDQAAALLAFATWLEGYGLGERREEGYGRLLVAHPFHQEVEAQ